MDSKVIPLRLSCDQWEVPSELDHQIRSIEHSAAFLTQAMNAMLTALDDGLDQTQMTQEDRHFYRLELPIVRDELDEALGRLKTLVDAKEADGDQSAAKPV